MSGTGPAIGPYQVLRRLGGGGMGEVFLAWDPRLEREVAVKRIRSETGADPERRARFRHEAKVTAALNHPAIVQVFDLITEEDDDHLVMEYVPGLSLHEVLRAGPLPNVPPPPPVDREGRLPQRRAIQSATPSIATSAAAPSEPAISRRAASAVMHHGRTCRARRRKTLPETLFRCWSAPSNARANPGSSASIRSWISSKVARSRSLNMAATSVAPTMPCCRSQVEGRSR